MIVAFYLLVGKTAVVIAEVEKAFSKEDRGRVTDKVNNSMPEGFGG